MVREMEAKYLGQGTVELTITFHVIEKNWKYILRIHCITNPCRYFRFLKLFYEMEPFTIPLYKCSPGSPIGKKGVRSLLVFNLRK